MQLVESNPTVGIGKFDGDLVHDIFVGTVTLIWVLSVVLLIAELAFIVVILEPARKPSTAVIFTVIFILWPGFNDPIMLWLSDIFSEET